MSWMQERAQMIYIFSWVHHIQPALFDRFDEFGFRVEEEDGPEQNSKKLLSQPFVEDPQHR